MENWSLVTYRETCLFVDDENTSNLRRRTPLGGSRRRPPTGSPVVYQPGQEEETDCIRFSDLLQDENKAEGDEQIVPVQEVSI